MNRSHVFYLFLVLLFTAGFIFANSLGERIISFWRLRLVVGTVIYPLTFLISNVVTELWGEKKARVMVLIAFFSCLSLFLFVDFLKIPIAISGLLLFASMSSFLIGQLLEIRLFQWMKQKTHSRWLWLRGQCSTLSSQVVDTCVVNSIILLGSNQLSFREDFDIILDSFIYKACFAFLMLPLLYLAVFSLRKWMFINEKAFF